MSEGRHCHLFVHGADSRLGDELHDVIVARWKVAAASPAPLVRVFCRDCTGKRQRARLGLVWPGGVAEFELVAPPRLRREGRPDRVAHRLPGWHRRGEPNTPQRLLVIDDAFDDGDPVPFPLFCPPHGARPLRLGELRQAYGRAVATGKPVNIGI